MSLLVPLILLPLVGAVLIAMAPEKAARQLALLTTLACAALFLVAALGFDFGVGKVDQLTVSNIIWFEPLGLQFRLGADTVSMLLIGLTVLLGPICVLASFSSITQRQKTYYSWFLVLQCAMTGVFCARDLALFYLFFEFTLVPMFILISLYGSTNRAHAAVKFFLYTFTGSVLTLAGLAYVAIQSHAATGVWSFDFTSIEQAARAMSVREQSWVFAALMAGFAVKVPIFPVHTWLPLAHTEAPTAGSVILAGVLLKLGTYGIYRFAIQMTPVAAFEHAPLMGVLGVLGILVAGLICWVQRDIKKLVAYSSVSHLGFCVLGLFALNSIGLSGSILYMINHGLSTGALFLLIGMIYERYHTRDFKELGGLASQMPVWSTFMVFFAMASVGLPGLNGFISEFMCLLGTFQAGGREWTDPATGLLLPGGTFGNLGPWFAVFAGAGMVVTAIYILYMVGNIVWGKYKAPGQHDDLTHGHDPHGERPHAAPHQAGHQHHDAGHGHSSGHAAGALPRDLNTREIGILIPLAIGCIWLGIYPTPILRALEEPVQSVVTQVRQDVQASGRGSLTASTEPAEPVLPVAAPPSGTGGTHR